MIVALELLRNGEWGGRRAGFGDRRLAPQADGYFLDLLSQVGNLDLLKEGPAGTAEPTGLL